MAECFRCDEHLYIVKTVEQNTEDIKEMRTEINDVKSDMNDLKLSQVEVNTTFVSFMKSMNTVPKILESLEKASIGTNYEIKDMKKSIEDIKKCQDDQKSEIKGIDNASKIDTRTFYTEKYAQFKGLLYIGCALGGAALAYAFSLIFK